MILDYYDNIIKTLRVLIIKHELFKQNANNYIQDINKKIQSIDANRDLLTSLDVKGISSTDNTFIENKLQLLDSSFTKISQDSQLFNEKEIDGYLDEFLSLLNKYKLFRYPSEKEINSMPLIHYDFKQLDTLEDGSRVFKNKGEQSIYRKQFVDYNNSFFTENKKNNKFSNMTHNKIFDRHRPALNIINIAKVFAGYIITNSSQHTSTMIGIFGQWGRGKTYFYEQIEKLIKEENKKIYFCKFQPWKYQQKESAWAYLYEQLINNYLDNKPTYLKKLIIKRGIKNKIIYYLVNKIDKSWKLLILNIKRQGIINLILSILSIAALGVFIYTSIYEKINFFISFIGLSGGLFLFKTYSFYIKSKNIAFDLYERYGKKIDYSNYLGFQNEIEKEIKYLINTYIDKDEKLILFIDDLDRCNEKMIIDIMDSLRLVLEDQEINSKIIMITAVDERILLKSIKHKYFDKNNANENIPISPIEYMEKFFLSGVKLSQIDDNDINELVDNYSKTLNELASETFSHENNESKIENLNSNKKLDSHNFENSKKIKNKESVSNAEDIDEKIVLNSNEICYMKKILSQLDIRTPRRVNMMIHRYLLFKSFIFIEFSKDEYEVFGHQILIELVFFPHKNPVLNSLVANSEYALDELITLIDMEDYRHTIKKKELIILLKYAEMVMPF